MRLMHDFNSCCNSASAGDDNTHCNLSLKLSIDTVGHLHQHVIAMHTGTASTACPSACRCHPAICWLTAPVHVFLQSESELSEAFGELRHQAGRSEPVLKPTRAMLDLQEKALAAGPDDEKLVVHVHSGVDIARKDIRTLKSRQWLNDEVMNVYMGLLQVSCAAAAV